MAYVHPIFGAVTVLLFFWVTTLGFRGRHRKPYARQARYLHGRLAWLTWYLVLFSVFGGTLSTALLRSDLHVATSWHFRVGWVLAGIMCVLAWTSRRFQRQPATRSVHPWLGIAALIIAPLLGALGFEMLP